MENIWNDDPRCLIVAPLYQGEEREIMKGRKKDLLVCADGGFVRSEAYGLRPGLVVGDFDSMRDRAIPDTEVLRLPVHKDDTDMEVCIEEGRKRGFHTFVMAGALGGRADHMIGNLELLCRCARRHEHAWLMDAQNRLTMLWPGTWQIDQMPGRKLSLAAWTPEVTGICLTGTEWPLQQAVLTHEDPIGISNEFRRETAELSFETGLLLVMLCRDA